MKLPVFPWEYGLVTDAQVRRLREKRMEGKTVSAAAAAAGMGERTAHRWQRGALPSAAKAPRTWRTREDPFADVWLSEVVPRLVADAAARLQVLTLFEWLCEQHPGRIEPGQLRTLQRRVRAWQAQHGPDHEVYFEQVAVPGREAAFHFTDASALGVTIRGVPFPHLLFEWVLSYSGWTYVALALSETFEALVAGVQGALWTLGAAPTVLRHDNLSAATRELRHSGGRQLTARFRQVLEHYGLRSSRIQPPRAAPTDLQSACIDVPPSMASRAQAAGARRRERRSGRWPGTTEGRSRSGGGDGANRDSAFIPGIQTVGNWDKEVGASFTGRPARLILYAILDKRLVAFLAEAPHGQRAGWHDATRSLGVIPITIWKDHVDPSPGIDVEHVALGNGRAW